jgi:outer membrane receptor for ferrienterochelin and colicins
MYRKLLSLIILICGSMAAVAQQDFSGKIIDPAGNPIPGATISIKKSKVSTTSGPDGTFSIPI